MPVFGDNQLTPEEQARDHQLRADDHRQADPGGAGIGRIGPVGEGLVIWVVGVGALMFGIFWMGSKA
jgi:ubiquinol-cytochrome c reductase cytochrome c subunit